MTDNLPPAPPADNDNKEDAAHARWRFIGDVLVLQGDAEALGRLARDRNFLLLTPFQADVRRPRKALISGLVMLGTVLGATVSQIGA